MKPEDVDFVDFVDSAVGNLQLRTAGKDFQRGFNGFNGLFYGFIDFYGRLLAN